MHPSALPPPPTSAGEWAAWVIAIACAIIVAQAAAIVWMFRDAKAETRVREDKLDAVAKAHAAAMERSTDARVRELQDTVKAVSPSADALHSLGEKVAVVVQRVDAHDEQHERHEERHAKLEERVDRWEERTPMPRKSQR